ncbi:hypothetical protein O3M35_007543 [Rhynocoris fuscipes]|uniref:MICOS complex subunit MIC10 n=1 Tax=Rhynocoris fuscipes TaxID=488301 RepID=A0AAW1DA00_9HEMI
MQSGNDQTERWEQCLIQGVQNIGVGIVLGLLASTLIFKRKRWAFLIGAGYGIGMAVAGCDYELNQKVILPPCKKKK